VKYSVIAVLIPLARFKPSATCVQAT